MADTSPGLLLSADLMFTSKICGTADSLGLRIEVLDDACEATPRLADTDYACLLIDLTVPGLDISNLIAGLPAEKRPWVIAFGPHVQTARLEAARTAGCDEVLPRSRFSAELPQLLAQVIAANR